MTQQIKIVTYCERCIGNIQLVHKKQIRFILNIIPCENIALNATSTYLNESNNHEHYRITYEVR